MVLRIQNDYGTLLCKFEGMCVWFCDNQSNDCYEALMRKIKSLYGDGTQLDYILIDCEKVQVDVFVVGRDDVLPLVVLSFLYVFRDFISSDLVKFINLFSRKIIGVTNGRVCLSRNRYYIRSSL